MTVVRIQLPNGAITSFDFPDSESYDEAELSEAIDVYYQQKYPDDYKKEMSELGLGLDKEYDRGVGSEIVEGLKRGAYKTAGIAKGLGALGLAAVGAEETADVLMEGYKQSMASAGEHPATVSTYKDVNSLGDMGMYAVGTIAELLPDIIGAIATGGVGAAVGKQVVKKGVTKLAARKLAEEAAKKTAKASLAGAAIASAGYNIGQEAGSISAEIKEETGQYRPGVALATGIVAGLVNTIAPMQVLKRMGLGKAATDRIVSNMVKEGVLKRVGKSVVKTGMSEGITEMLQTKIEQGALHYAKGENLLETSPAEMEEIINSFFMGVIGGSAIGGLTALPGRPPLAEEVEKAREILTMQSKEGEAISRGLRLPLPPTIIPPEPKKPLQLPEYGADILATEIYVPDVESGELRLATPAEVSDMKKSEANRSFLDAQKKTAREILGEGTPWGEEKPYIPEAQIIPEAKRIAQFSEATLSETVYITGEDGKLRKATPEEIVKGRQGRERQEELGVGTPWGGQLSLRDKFDVAITLADAHAEKLEKRLDIQDVMADLAEQRTEATQDTTERADGVVEQRSEEDKRIAVESVLGVEKYQADPADETSEKTIIAKLDQPEYEEHVKPLNPDNPDSIVDYMEINPEHTHFAMVQKPSGETVVQVGSHDNLIPKKAQKVTKWGEVIKETKAGELPVEKVAEKPAVAEKPIEAEKPTKKPDEGEEVFRKAETKEVTIDTIKTAFPSGVIKPMRVDDADAWEITLPNKFKVLVKPNMNIIVDPAAYEKTYGEKLPPGEKILGSIQMSDKAVMKLAKMAGQETVDHESFHLAMRTVLTPDERNAMYDKYRKEAQRITGKENPSELEIEEVAAEAYAKWDSIAGRDGDLFQKIMEFFRQIVASFRAAIDKRSVEDVMVDIRKGKIFEREAQVKTKEELKYEAQYQAKRQKPSPITSMITETEYNKESEVVKKTVTPFIEVYPNENDDFNVRDDEFIKTIEDMGILFVSTSEQSEALYFGDVDNPLRIAAHEGGGRTALSSPLVNKWNSSGEFSGKELIDAVEKWKKKYVKYVFEDKLEEVLSDNDEISKAEAIKIAKDETISSLEYEAKWSMEEKNTPLSFPLPISDDLSDESYGTQYRVKREYSPEVEKVKARLTKEEPAPLPEKMKKGLHNLRNNFRQGVLDQFDSIRTVLDDKRAWMMAHLTKSAIGALDATINYGAPYMKENAVSIKEGSQGLSEILKPLGDEVDDFLQWIAGNRAEKLSAEDRENFLSDEDIKALKSLNQGTMEDGQSRQKVYEDTRKKFEELHDAVVQLAVDNGTINAELAARWRDEGFYVPFYRAMEEGESRGTRTADSLVRQTAFKQLKGSDKPFDDLLSNVLQNWNHLISSGLNNQAAVYALHSAKKLGIARQVNEKTKSKDAVFVRVNGEKTYFEVDEPLVLEALSGLNRQDVSGMAVNVMRSFKRVLTTGVTASPDFKLRNLFRDTLQAIAVAPMSVNIVKNLAQGWKGTKIGSKTDVAMLAGGGGFGDSGYIHGADPEAIKRLVDTGIDESAIIKHPKDWIKHVWKSWQDFGARLENINRSANFQQILEKEGDLLEANFQARDHLDFSRTGSWGAVRWLAQVVPFLNARLQGLDKIARAAADPKQRGQMAAVVGTYSAMTVLIYLAMKDDDDFKERAEWEKDTYIFFKLSKLGLPPIEKDGKELMFALPKPFEVGVIGTMAERFAEQIVDDKAHGELFRERAIHALSQTLSMNPIPQVIMPAAEVIANKSAFTGRAIESMSMKNLKPTERKKVWTSQTAIGASYLMNKVLWDDVTLSPVQIEHLVKGYAGWLGNVALWGADLIADPLSDKPEAPARRLDQYPVAKSFIRQSPARFTKYGQQFYKNMAELTTIKNTISAHRKEGDLKQARSMMKTEKEKLKYGSIYSRVSKQLSALRKREENIYANKTMSPSAKLKQINEITVRKNALLKRAIEKTGEAF